MDRLLELFAGIIEAPTIDLLERVRECARCAEAVGVPADGLAEFERFVEATPPQRLAESYEFARSSIGRQLYGEGYGRSMLLLDLQKRYRRNGFQPGDEPADNLSVLLRFLSECEDPAEREELARDVLIPALESMIKENAFSPSAVFTPLLRTLSSALREQVGS